MKKILLKSSELINSFSIIQPVEQSTAILQKYDINKEGYLEIDRKILEAKPSKTIPKFDPEVYEMVQKFKKSFTWISLKENNFLQNNDFVKNIFNEYYEKNQLGFNKNQFIFKANKNLNDIIKNEKYFNKWKEKQIFQWEQSLYNFFATNKLNNPSINYRKNVEQQNEINNIKLNLNNLNINENNIKNKTIENEKINEFFSNLEINKKNFLNDLSNLKEKRNNYYNYLKNVKILNNLSIAITTAEWALAATYSAMAFATFGATAVLATTSGINATISTVFTVLAKESEKEIEAGIKKIDEFLNSKDVIDAEITLKEIDFNELRKKINENINEIKVEVDVWEIGRGIYNLTPFSALKKAIPMLTQHLLTNFFSSKLFKINLNLLEKFNSINLSASSRQLARKAFDSVANSIQKFSSKLIIKKTTIMVTSILSPISKLLSFADFLISTASIANEVIYSKIL
ncbi:hypothetical protein [[Mycoplasma] collis]|uniref:hypothetical protein n=1 Tax=[Mycoplasma] collis TaxID=2127 RepID=UPI00051B9E65|nr:hypothetical protein [[Mycoplasma] collis]